MLILHTCTRSSLNISFAGTRPMYVLAGRRRAAGPQVLDETPVILGKKKKVGLRGTKHQSPHSAAGETEEIDIGSGRLFPPATLTNGGAVGCIQPGKQLARVDTYRCLLPGPSNVC